MIVAIIILLDMCKAKMCKYFSSDATNQNNAWFVFHFLSYALLLTYVCQKQILRCYGPLTLEMQCFSEIPHIQAQYCFQLHFSTKDNTYD